MDKLWAPWRYKYIKDTVSAKNDKCIFCELLSENNDKENFIIYRGKKAYIMLNRYPYNNGHVMVIPYGHFSEMSELSDEEMLEIMKLLDLSVKVLKSKFSSDGFNIGINLGRTAGAGIDDHIHFHVVPRWNGDTNFMPVIGGTKIISQSLKESWEILKKGFVELDNK